ncbi:MAG: transketolase [Acidimicrobiales bacterium]
MTEPAEDRNIEQRAINVIRGLAMDGPERANSGHSGTAMALAPLAHVLFTRIMRYDAGDPDWFDRDRFILSNGHASILQYSMLYLTGYGLDLDDLKAFRQFGSKTPGHPEVHHLPGIEVTTGPLGQGFAQSVGVAMAERLVRHRYGPGLCDHYIFGTCGDGDLMEGVSHEAASLAGHLGLGKLVFVFDDNHITIDGATELATGDDASKRFEAYGWHVVRLGDVANDLDILERGLRDAMAEAERPSLVIVRSHIGWPSPHRTDTKEAHGEVFGAEEIRQTKQLLDLPPDEEFYVPADVLSYYRAAGARGHKERDRWVSRREAMDESDRAGFEASLAGKGLKGWEDRLPTFATGGSLATRKAINEVMTATAECIPGLVSGAADLTGNTGTKLDLEDAMSLGNPGGRQIHYGIREFAMASALNGMALHNGVLPVGGTFFAFSDYCRPAIRLGAMSQAHAVLFFTHDSIGLGEDGPTHQPIEQLASLRAMPRLRLIRPADANECAAAWRVAVDEDGLTALVLTRQEVPVLDGTMERAAEGLARGAYVLCDEDEQGAPDIVLVGTGSEVQHCVAARAALAAQGVDARVVSFPCWDLFESQDEAYQDSVLPAGVPTLAVEAASSFGWDRYADASVTIDHFGASAPGGRNMEEFGFTATGVTRRAQELLASSNLEQTDKEER